MIREPRGLPIRIWMKDIRHVTTASSTRKGFQSEREDKGPGYSPEIDGVGNDGQPMRYGSGGLRVPRGSERGKQDKQIVSIPLEECLNAQAPETDWMYAVDGANIVREIVQRQISLFGWIGPGVLR